MLRRIIATAIWCVLLLLPFGPEAHTQVRTIFLVRHADKVSDAYDAPLSDQGLKRAKCLADTLADASIDQIFTSDLQRTQQTAAPLVLKRGLKPVVIPMNAPDSLVEAIRASKAAHVLVVWHGGTLPKVLHALGGPQVAAIDEAEYDRFYILTLAADAHHPAPRFTALRYCDR